MYKQTVVHPNNGILFSEKKRKKRKERAINP